MTHTSGYKTYMTKVGDEAGEIQHVIGRGEAGVITGIIYSMMMRRLPILFILVGLSLILLTACNRGSTVTISATATHGFTATVTGTPEPSQTPIPPSQTPIPLAATVNGEAITLDEFQAELTRFQESATITGTNLAPDPNTTVLDELIDQTLLAQSAEQNGFIVDDVMLQSRIDDLQTQLGSAQALGDWKAAHGYSDDAFREALRRAAAAAWMRDQIIASVPETADQVHVIQILLPTAAEAAEVYTQLQTGADFMKLANAYDPATGGDLGWFPRDYLGEPAIDQAVFALQPKQYSQVVETEIGFHFFYLVERDANHPLQPDARMALQAKAMSDWLSEKRQQSDIQVFIKP